MTVRPISLAWLAKQTHYASFLEAVVGLWLRDVITREQGAIALVIWARAQQACPGLRQPAIGVIEANGELLNVSWSYVDRMSTFTLEIRRDGQFEWWYVNRLENIEDEDAYRGTEDPVDALPDSALALIVEAGQP